MNSEAHQHGFAAAGRRPEQDNGMEASAGCVAVDGLEYQRQFGADRRLASAWVDLSEPSGLARHRGDGRLGASDGCVFGALSRSPLGATTGRRAVLQWPTLPSGTAERMGGDHRADLHQEQS